MSWERGWRATLLCVLWCGPGGEPVAAQTTFEACEAWLDEEPDSESAARCFYEVARDVGTHDDAARRLQRRILEQPENPGLRLYLGNIESLRRSCENSLEAYRQSIHLFEQQEAWADVNRARTSLAWELAICGELESSREALDQASASAESLADALAILRVQLVDLRLQTYEGDIERAYEELADLWLWEVDRAVLDDRLGIADLRREWLRVLHNTTMRLGRSKEAGQWFDRRIELAQSTGDLRAEVAARCDRLGERVAQELPSQATRQELQAQLTALLPDTERSALLDAEALVRLHLAKMVGGPQATAHLARCQFLAEKSDDTRLLRLCGMAQASHWLADDSGKAARQLASLEEAGHWPETPLAVAETWRDLLEVAWHTRSRAVAIAAAERVLATVEARRRQQSGVARLQLLDVRSGPYYWLAGRLLEPSERTVDAVAAAFAVMERLRAQELREVLWQAKREATLAVLPPPSDLLNEIRAALGDDEALLSYQFGTWQDGYGRFAGGSWVLVLTRDDVQVHQLEADRVEMEELARSMVSPHSPWAPQDLDRLAGALLEPAVEGLPGEIKRLVLVPDGALHLLPFAALPSGGNKPLGVAYELSVQPSAALWLEWRTQSSVERRAALVFSDPDLGNSSVSVGKSASRRVRQRGESLKPLLSARHEGRKIVRHLGGRSRLLLGPEAKASVLEQEDLSAFGLLHFATHAVANHERPWRSGLRLAGNGEQEDAWLRPEEIAELDLQGKVVVLSACDSATGGVLRGEGVMSLARAFFEAGAHAVVGTLRRLPDQAGAAFFDDFYRHLSRGLSLRQALAQTQRQWASDGQPATVWASVVVLGNGDLVPLPGGVAKPLFSQWMAMAVVILAGLMALVLYQYLAR